MAILLGKKLAREATSTHPNCPWPINLRHSLTTSGHLKATNTSQPPTHSASQAIYLTLGNNPKVTNSFS